MCWPDSSEIDASSFHDTALACVLLRVYLRATGRGDGILNLRGAGGGGGGGGGGLGSSWKFSQNRLFSCF